MDFAIARKQTFCARGPASLSRTCVCAGWRGVGGRGAKRLGGVPLGQSNPTEPSIREMERAIRTANRHLTFVKSQTKFFWQE
jgi:hypothetical protein